MQEAVVVMTSESGLREGVVSSAQVELENMLGDALGELEYLRTNQEIGIRAVQLLQRKAHIKHKDAERQLALLGSSNTQKESTLSGQLLRQEFKLSRTKLECLQWKRRAAVLQLKLDSTQEDCQQWKRAHAISSSRLREVHDQLSESEDAHTVSQAALDQSYESLRAQKLLTEAAEARVVSALSNAGKTKSDLQTNLHNATTEVKNLSSQLQECQQKLSAASDDLTGCQSAHHLKEKAAQEEIASLRATVARTESIIEERVQAVTDKAQAMETHLKELLSIQRTERASAEDLWKGRVSDLQAQVDQMKRSNESLHQEIASVRAEAQQIAVKKTSIHADGDRQGEAEAAMSQISELVDLMYDPSPQASPVKETNQRPAQPAAVRPPAKPSAVFAPAILVPKKGPKAAKPQAKKTQVAPRQKDVYALEASPEPEEAKPALSQAANRSEDPSGQQSKQKSPKEAAQILTADPAADVQKEKPAVKRSHQPDTKEDQKQKPISKTSPEADAPLEVLQKGNGRPQRQRRQTQPFWMGDAASKGTPATLSPTPSVPDHDDLNDPSFTFGLSQAEPGNPVAPGVSKTLQGMDDADEPQQAKEMENDTAMLPAFSMDEPVRPSTKDATAPQGRETVTAAVHYQEPKNGRKRALGKVQGKAGGKKSRLGPHANSPPAQVVQVNDILPQEEAPRQIQEASQPAATHIAAENDQQAVPVKLTTEEGDEPAATRKSGRPLGISKIDLRTVWGSRTPMPGSETELQEAGLPTAALPQQSQAAGPADVKPVAGTQQAMEAASAAEQPGLRLEAAPLAALNDRVMQAAKDRVQAPPAQTKPKPKHMPPPPPPGTRRSQLAKPNGAKPATHKRKLQPSAYVREDATRDMLLGPLGGFKIPRLRKPN